MIALQTALTERGIVCYHPRLGEIATLQHEHDTQLWYVFPYRFPPYERAARFKSLHAAQAYALALLHEEQETMGPRDAGSGPERLTHVL